MDSNPPTRPRRPALAPDARFHLAGSATEPAVSVLHLWSWALGDLQANNNRGVLAEFIVATAIGATVAVRESWADFDLTGPGGEKVEVKSSGYLQTWASKAPSLPKFSGLKAKAWSPETGYALEPSFRADIYVFALQTALSQQDYDPLDLAQWKFWVAPLAVVARLNQKSFSLATVESQLGEGVGYPLLSSAFLGAVQHVV